MIKVRTLGTTELVGAGHLGLAALAAQPKRMGLLAYLAVAAPRGFHRRDSLLALFWPEAGSSDARTSLRQAVYQIRRVLGKDAVIGRGDEEMALNPKVVSCDVQEFEQTLSAGETLAALALYRGEFLTGFFVPDAAPALDEWMAGERTRLRGMAAGAAWSTAQTAERSGNSAAASLWAHRAAAFEPENEDSFRRLLTLLGRIGDRVAALRAYDGYARRLHEELGIEPSRDIRAIADRLREEELRASGGSRIPSATPSPASATAALSTSSARQYRPWLAAAVVLLLGAIAVSLTWHRSTALTSPVLAVGAIVDYSRGDSARSPIVADLLTTSVSRLAGVQVISTGRMYELRTQLAASEGRPAKELEAARLAGASALLEGTIHQGAGGTLRFDVSVLDVRSGRLRQGLRADGISTFALVDQVTNLLAQELGAPPPDQAVADVTTHSLVAYRLYEEGLRAYYQSDASGALRLFNAALAEDSGFAMAAYQAALISPATPLLLHLRELAARATDRERLLILSTVAVELFEPSALALAETLAVRYPNEPAAHLQLGEVRAFAGDFPGALAELRRTIVVDSLSLQAGDARCRACDAYEQMTLTFLLADSVAGAERTAREWIGRRPGGTAWHWLGSTLERQGRTSEAWAAYFKADSISPGMVDYDISRALGEIRQGSFAAADDRLRRIIREGSTSRRVTALWWLSLSLRNQGRLEEAAALPIPKTGDGVYTIPLVLAESGHPREAAAIWQARAGQVGDWPRDFPAMAAKHRAWNLTHTATALAEAGDTTRLAALADTVERMGEGSLYGRDRLIYHYVNGLLLAARQRPDEAASEYRHAIWSWSDGYTRANYELARTLLVLGRAGEAVAALQPAFRGPLDANNLYITHTELHEMLARAFDAAGQPDSARTHWAAVEQAWRSADPRFRPRYLAARDKLSR